MIMTTDVDQPHRRAGFRADIQGLRALAVTLVVLFHAGAGIDGGFLGVDVFFVISGFVITSTLWREYEADGRVSLKRFYAKRFRRLTPALAAMVGFVVIASALFMSPLGPQGNTIATAFGALFLFANFAIATTTGGYFDAAAESNPLLHTWSLSVEEQFYLIFPILLILIWRYTLRDRIRVASLLAVLALFGLSLALSAYTAAGNAVPYAPEVLFGFYGPVTRVWEFAAGALLVFLPRRAAVLPTALSNVMSLVGLVVVAVSVVVISENTPWLGVATLAPVVGTMLIISAGADPDGLQVRLLGARPFVWLGDRSYSWYLWHWPLIVFAVIIWPDSPVAAPLAAVVSLAFAYASFVLIESPARATEASRRKTAFRLVVATVVPALLLTSVLAVAHAEAFWSPVVARFSEASQLHAAQQAGCMTMVDPGERDLAACTWGTADGADLPVYLVGDSNAEHFSEGLIAATQAAGTSLTVLAAPGCPPFRFYAYCSTFVDGTQDVLESVEPGIVVIATADQHYWDPLAGASVGSTVSDPDVKAKLLESSLGAMIADLRDAGHRVAIVQAVPSFWYPAPAWDPATCTAAAMTSGGCSRSVELSFVDGEQSLSRRMIERAAESNGATILDFRDELCPDAVCQTQVDGEVRYIDPNHISVATSASFAPQFGELIAALTAQP
jgi:peptidoglycan/LPS O-acetylase OafA/YrhL